LAVSVAATDYVTDETDRLSVSSVMPQAIRCHIRYIRYAAGYPLPPKNTEIKL
jgi:hypothetical protein